MTNTQKNELIKSLKEKAREYREDLDGDIEELNIKEIRRTSTKIVVINETIEAINKLGVNLAMWRLLNEMTDTVSMDTKVANSLVIELYINLTAEN